MNGRARRGEGAPNSRLVALQKLWEAVVRAVPLLGWVSYLPLLITLLALLLVIAGVGAHLGIPSLIWHDDRLTQALAGFAAAALSMHLGMVGYLLDDQDREDHDQRDDHDVSSLPTGPGGAGAASGAGGPDATVGHIARYVSWPSGALLVCAAIGLIRQKEVRWHGALVMMGPVAAFLLMIRFRNSPRRLSYAPAGTVLERAVRIVKRGDRRSRWARQGHVDHGAHALQAVIMAVLAVLYGVAYLLRWVVPAAVAMALALALVTGLWGLFAFWMQRYRLMGMGALLLVAFVAGVTRDVPPRDLSAVQLTCDQRVAGSALIGDRAALIKWRDRLAASGQPRPPLVVVVTSGGASRAALWTITVLAELEERLPGFMRHVRIITGASGGMVGAAHYVAGLDASSSLPAGALAQIRRAAAADSLSAVTRALILPGGDRGAALEDAWERNSGGRLAAPFVSLAQGERAGWRPSLIFAPVLVEDGRRLMISNLDLAAITTAPAPLLRCEGAGCAQSQSAVQLFACPGQGLDRLRISTVARLNATFPWVTSAALLPSQPARRVVDAGYYDDYGVNIAAAWINRNAAWLKENTSGVLLVQIRDGLLERRHWEVRTPPGPGYLHEWISALTTPIEAFLNVQDSSMSFRNDSEIALLSKHPLLATPPRFLVTTPFEFAGDAPLNWYLSAEAVERLSHPPPARELAPLIAWWNERITPPSAAAPALESSPAREATPPVDQKDRQRAGERRTWPAR